MKNIINNFALAIGLFATVACGGQSMTRFESHGNHDDDVAEAGADSIEDTTSTGGSSGKSTNSSAGHATGGSSTSSGGSHSTSGSGGSGDDTSQAGTDSIAEGGEGGATDEHPSPDQVMVTLNNDFPRMGACPHDVQEPYMTFFVKAGNKNVTLTHATVRHGGTGPASDVHSVALGVWDNNAGDNLIVSDVVALESDIGDITFTNGYLIPAGTSKTFYVLVWLDGKFADTHSFELDDLGFAEDVDVQADFPLTWQGIPIIDDPICNDDPGQDHGVTAGLAVTTPKSAIVVPANESTWTDFATYNISNYTNEARTFDTVGFTVDFPQDFRYVTYSLNWTNSSVQNGPISDPNQIIVNPITIQAHSTGTITFRGVLADVVSRSVDSTNASAHSGDQPRVQLTSITGPNVDDVRVTDRATPAMVLRKAVPTVSLNNDELIPRGRIASFRISAQGTLAVKQAIFTFDVSPGVTLSYMGMGNESESMWLLLHADGGTRYTAIVPFDPELILSPDHPFTDIWFTATRSGFTSGSTITTAIQEDGDQAEQEPITFQVIGMNSPGVFIGLVANPQPGPPLSSAFIWSDLSEGANHADYNGSPSNNPQKSSLDYETRCLVPGIDSVQTLTAP